jgi:UDP-N-acetylmuramoyl-tripeptide--D-alanyl-D-alanine ligase
VIPLSLTDIADVLGVPLVAVPDAELCPAGVARIDSRDVEPGDLFLCVEGDSLDGHDFVEQALDRGAVLSIAARTVAGPHVVVPDVVAALARVARATLARRPGTAVVGITGSSGKTSTKDLVATVLEDAAETISPPGSFNNELGLPMTVLRTTDTTRFLVLEMGARGVGHIRALCEIAPPHVGAVLNVGTAHVGEFGGPERVALAKGELVESLAADGTAVLNLDDPRVAAMRERTGARVLTFGRSADADIRATDVTLDSQGRAAFTLSTPDGAAPVTLLVVGEHQVANALAAAAIARALGIATEAIADSLSRAAPRSPWRMEVVEASDGLTIVNDAYNANPESVAAALDALVSIGGERRTWAVLGEMRELGEHSEAAHAAVGRRVVELGIDRLVVVGDGARAVLDAARAAGASEDATWFVADTSAATELLRAEVARFAPADVVLVKASRAVGLEVVAEALRTTRKDAR